MRKPQDDPAKKLRLKPVVNRPVQGESSDGGNLRIGNPDPNRRKIDGVLNLRNTGLISIGKKERKVKQKLQTKEVDSEESEDKSTDAKQAETTKENNTRYYSTNSDYVRPPVLNGIGVPENTEEKTVPEQNEAIVNLTEGINAIDTLSGGEGHDRLEKNEEEEKQNRKKIAEGMSSVEKNEKTSKVSKAVASFNTSVRDRFDREGTEGNNIPSLLNYDMYKSSVIASAKKEEHNISEATMLANENEIIKGHEEILELLGEVTESFKNKVTDIINTAKDEKVNFGLDAGAIENLKKLKGVGERDREDKFESNEAEEISGSLIQNYLMNTEYKDFKDKKKQDEYFEVELNKALREFWDKLDVIKADDGENVTDDFIKGVGNALAVAKSVKFRLTDNQIEKIKRIPIENRNFESLISSIQDKLQTYLETEARINGVDYEALTDKKNKKTELLEYAKKAFKEGFEKFLKESIVYIEEKPDTTEQGIKEVEEKVNKVNAPILKQAEHFKTKSGLEGFISGFNFDKYKGEFKGENILTNEQKTTFAEEIERGHEELLRELREKLSKMPAEEQDSDDETETKPKDPLPPPPAPTVQNSEIATEIERIRDKRAKLLAKRPKWYNFFSGDEKKKINTAIGKLDLEILKLQEQKKNNSTNRVANVDLDAIDTNVNSLSKRKLKAELKDDRDEYDNQIRDRIIQARSEAKVKYDNLDKKKRELEARLKDRSLDKKKRNEIESQVKKIKEEIKIEKRQDRKLWLEEANRTKGVGKRLFRVVNEQGKNPATYWKGLWYAGLGVGIAALGIFTGGTGLAGLGMAALKGASVGAIGKMAVGARERYLDNRDAGEEDRYKDVYNSPRKLAKDFLVGGAVGAVGGALAKGLSDIASGSASAEPVKIIANTNSNVSGGIDLPNVPGIVVTDPVPGGAIPETTGSINKANIFMTENAVSNSARPNPEFIINEGLDRISNNRSLWDMLQKIGMSENQISDLYQTKGRFIARDIMKLTSDQGLMTPELRSAYRALLRDGNITGDEAFWSLLRDKLDLNLIIKKVMNTRN